jgi:hypothetical protein
VEQGKVNITSDPDCDPEENVAVNYDVPGGGQTPATSGFTLKYLNPALTMANVDGVDTTTEWPILDTTIKKDYTFASAFSATEKAHLKLPATITEENWVFSITTAGLADGRVTISATYSGTAGTEKTARIPVSYWNPNEQFVANVQFKYDLPTFSITGLAAHTTNDAVEYEYVSNIESKDDISFTNNGDWIVEFVAGNEDPRKISITHTETAATPQALKVWYKITTLVATIALTYEP